MEVNANGGRSRVRSYIKKTSPSADGLEDNPASVAAIAQFPAAMSYGVSNNPQGISTTMRLTSDCPNPNVDRGSDGSSISLPISISSAGTNFRESARTVTHHPNKKRSLEATEDDKISRSTLRFNSNDYAGTGLLSLKEDNSGKETIASTGSNNSNNKLPNAMDVSLIEQDVAASKEGIKFYSVNDVLCGRGGGTNVHPGNRRFRDLVNTNRRAYLMARKNDKPTISRSIVRAFREINGRFLKKDDHKDLWFEIGDDCAREKTSQALRQRAPEMRKILQEDEQRQQQQLAERQMMMHRHQLMALAGGVNFTQMNALAGMGGSFNPSSMIDNQLMGQSSSIINSELSQSLLANYFNLLQQTNWLAQQEQQNMIFQQLSMAGINPHSINTPALNHLDSNIATHATIQQVFNPVVTRGA